MDDRERRRVALFAPEAQRQHVVDWQAPQPVARFAAALSGIETMQAIRDGLLPPPPIAKLMGFMMRSVEPGVIGMAFEPHESLENPMGLLHGGAAATLLDTVMGCAISTLLPAGQGAVTLDLKLTYLRPLSARSGLVSAEGKVIKLGRQTSYAEGFVRDSAGQLAVHATATFAMVGLPGGGAGKGQEASQQ